MNKEAMERYQVLSECLVMVEADVRRFSRNQAAVSPMPEYEAAWKASRRKAAVLREMLLELRYEAAGPSGVEAHP